VRAGEGIIRAVACSRTSKAIARAVVGARNIRREIAQNAASGYIFAARVKMVPLLEKYTARAIKKAVIIERRYFSATAGDALRLRASLVIPAGHKISS
jgi:hypothetical protein